MDPRVRRLLENGDITRAKAKAVCRTVLTAPPGQERAVLEAELAKLAAGASSAAPKKVLSYRMAAKRLKGRKEHFRVTGDDVVALLHLLRARQLIRPASARVHSSRACPTRRSCLPGGAGRAFGAP